MQGTIEQIKFTDKDHAVIAYTDIDTSCGQSGSMILLVEDQSKLIDMIDFEYDDLKEFPAVTRLEVSADQRVESKANDVRICSTNIGVHVAGNHGRNWGTVITPTIM